MGDPFDVRTTPEVLSQLASPRLLAFWAGGTSSFFLPGRGAITIGRGERCELRIDHTSVSREHARVICGAEIAIEDLDSSNGVRVRGVRLASRCPTTIRAGDVVELGAAVIVLQEPRAMTHSEARGADAMQATERLIDLVSQSDISVTLLGETGVGKNVAAARIHAGSRRAAAPLVSVNCAALPEQLLEAELFGYERGAFTGAIQTKRGLIESADGGSVLLDEIGEMPLHTQAKLLAVVESRQVTRLGSVTPRAIDVRFFAATNRDLEALAAAGMFRQDLFFRLNGISIHIPPLRERPTEIGKLATSFVNQACERAGRPPARLASESLARLMAHGWPGNLRELKNTIERALVLCGGGEVRPEHIQISTLKASAPPPPREAAPPSTEGALLLRNEMEALERRRIVEALETHGGNQTRAAKALGLSRTALIARMEAYGLPRPRKR
jgi:transcriptional regulator with PAS, ATPase and Fis domain